VSDTSKSVSLLSTIISKQYHFMTSSDRFPIPVRSSVKSNLTAWCCQNLSSRALNALTVQASTLLFVIVREAISIEFRDALSWKLLHADDLAVTAENEEELIKKFNRRKDEWRVKV